MALFSNRTLKKLRQYVPALAVLFFPSSMIETATDKNAEALSIAKNEAALSYVQTYYGKHSLSEKDLYIVDTAQTTKTMRQGLEIENGKPLSIDELYETLDATTHLDLFRQAYPTVREQALPDTLSPALDVMAAPLQGSFKQIKMTSRFGWRKLFGRHHNGVDLVATGPQGQRLKNQAGQPVSALLDGVVVESTMPRGRKIGTLKVRSGDLEYTYLHVKPLNGEGEQLRVGDVVKRGEIVSEIGPRDRHSTGAHLHVELARIEENRYGGTREVQISLNNLIAEKGMIATNGSRIKTKPSKLGKEIGGYNVDMLKEDVTGADFYKIPERLNKEFAKKASTHNLFRQAADFIMMIGGGSKYKDDTKWEVAGHSHPGLNIKRLSRKRARAIHKEESWDAIHADKLSPKFAVVALDAMINVGPAAKKLIAQADNNPEKLIQLRRDRVKGKSFERGINNRLDKVEEFISAMPDVTVSKAGIKQVKINDPKYKHRMKNYEVVAKLIEKEKKKNFAHRYKANAEMTSTAMHRVDAMTMPAVDDFIYNSEMQVAKVTPKPAQQKTVTATAKSTVAPVEVFMAAQRSMLAEARQKENLSGKAMPKEVVAEKPVQSYEPSTNASSFADTRSAIFADSRKPIAGFGPPQKPQWDHKRAYTYA